MWMLVTGGESELEKNFNRAQHQRFGFCQPVRALYQSRQIVEICGDFGMVSAEALLINRQRTPN